MTKRHCIFCDILDNHSTVTIGIRGFSLKLAVCARCRTNHSLEDVYQRGSAKIQEAIAASSAKAQEVQETSEETTEEDNDA